MKKQKISVTTELFINALFFIAIFCLALATQNNEFWSRHSGMIQGLYNITLIVLALLGLKTKPITDEMSKAILQRTDQISGTFMTVVFLFLAVLLISPYPFLDVIDSSRQFIGITILALLAVWRLLRVLLFFYYNRRGISDVK